MPIRRLSLANSTVLAFNEPCVRIDEAQMMADLQNLAKKQAA